MRLPTLIRWRVHLRRTVLAAVAATLAGPAVAFARPAFTVRPGPAPVALTWEVAAVPRQPQAVFHARGAFWTLDAGTWYRAHHRRTPFVAVARHRVPQAVLRLGRADQREAERVAAGTVRVRIKAAPVVLRLPKLVVADDDAKFWEEQRAARKRYLTKGF